MMDRRSFLAIVVGLLTAPLAAEAQQTRKLYRVGWLDQRSPSGARPEIEVFTQAMRELGWAEGKNIAFEFRFAEYKAERLPELAVEIVRLNVDLIVAIATPGVQAARQATTTIPIVMHWVGDPVESGLVSSLARPGGNVTGMSLFGLAVWTKSLELLKQAAPRISRVAVLRDPMNRAQHLIDPDLDAAAKALGLVLQRIDVGTEADIDGALAATLRQHADAVLLYPLRVDFPHLQRIADFAITHRLPLSFPVRRLAAAGGLMSYGPSIMGQTRSAALYVDKILKGAKPADLPVEQPTTFELVINLKTAKALGLTIPPSLLQRADEVIQ
jgi:putative tryptophan/tyrosine transport system substrate-binding protein